MYRNLERIRDWLPEFQQNKNSQFWQLLQADRGCDNQRECAGYGFKEWNLSVTQALFPKHLNHSINTELRRTLS